MCVRASESITTLFSLPFIGLSFARKEISAEDRKSGRIRRTEAPLTASEAIENGQRYRFFVIPVSPLLCLARFGARQVQSGQLSPVARRPAMRILPKDSSVASGNRLVLLRKTRSREAVSCQRGPSVLGARASLFVRPVSAARDERQVTVSIEVRVPGCRGSMQILPKNPGTASVTGIVLNPTTRSIYALCSEGVGRSSPPWPPQQETRGSTPRLPGTD